MKRARLYITLIIISIFISLFLPILIVSINNLTRNWSFFPNQLVHWDVNINLNGNNEFDYVECIFPNLEQSRSIKWFVNLWNPFSLIRDDWNNAYGNNAWNERYASWQLSGTFYYNVTGNLDENIPVDLNLNTLFIVPLRGTAEITIEKIDANVTGTIKINNIDYYVEEEPFSYKLTASLTAPSPKINSISETFYINKFDGSLIESITIIDGTGVHGWEYVKTIHVTQSYLFWIILLIACVSSIATFGIVYWKKFYRKIDLINEEI
ncbi:MAG: hypothetical protein ACTSVE_03130 [Candidatus Helarchaeota archaeon]